MKPDEKIQIKTEIEILKQLDHPNIVKMMDVFEDEKYWCIVMELLKGGELFDEILLRDHFSEFEAREATKSLIDAIHYCHELGIMHRDIKPENLLIADKAQGISSLKLADFGLSRALDPDTMASTVCGTPGYISPEIIDKQPYGKQCDNWSIGVVTYILLSGVPPFFEEDDWSMFQAIKNCKYDFKHETW